MKKVILSIIFISSISLVSNAQDDKLPFHVKNFLEEYGFSMDDFLNAEELNRNFEFDRFFLNINDTLFWPDNFNLEDKFFKHRLGPKEYYQKFARFKNVPSLIFIYSLREMAEVRHIKTTSSRLYDKFRVNAIENHIFSNAEYGQKDSTVSFSNYYDIIS